MRKHEDIGSNLLLPNIFEDAQEALVQLARVLKDGSTQLIGGPAVGGEVGTAEVAAGAMIETLVTFFPGTAHRLFRRKERPGPARKQSKAPPGATVAHRRGAQPGLVRYFEPSIGGQTGISPITGRLGLITVPL